MILCIDTKSKDVISVALKIEGEIVDKLSDENEYGSQVLLPLILKILKNNKDLLRSRSDNSIALSRRTLPSAIAERKLEFKDLEGIEAETGPGSYTGLKVGASVANALGFSLNIPVNGKKMETDLKY